MSEHILYSKDGAIASLRFNRPEKKNAITVAMYQALVDGLDDAARDEQIRAVGIFGGDAFTAGNDLGDFLAASALGDPEDLPVIKLIRAMIAFPKPLLAGVKGPAIGFGTTLLMHCDAVVAGRSARERTERLGGDEALRPRRYERHDVVPALHEEPADLASLVGRNAAADSEQDPRHAK